MAGTEQELKQSLTKQARVRFEEAEPSEERKQELRREHHGHLVRNTTSKFSLSPDLGDGIEATTTAEIPDIYCFSCGEWVGVSGVDLRGTPRSKKDAYYLGGKPVAVKGAEQGTRNTLNELADALTERISHIDGREDAYQFIERELERGQDEISGDGGGSLE